MLTGMSRDKLYSLKTRRFDIRSTYDSVLVVPSTAVDDNSGYRLMLIVGVVDGEPVDIAASCDDVMWAGGSVNGDAVNSLRFDMDPANDCVHVWGNYCRFEVGIAGESTTVTVKYTLDRLC